MLNGRWDLKCSTFATKAGREDAGGRGAVEGESVPGPALEC